MNRTGARRKASCAQERSVPRRTGRRAAVGETVPAHRGILFLGEPAGCAGGASRFGQPCRRRVCPRGNSRTGALHVSANCVGGRSVRGRFPHRQHGKGSRAQGRFTFRPTVSATSLSRGNSRTGALPSPIPHSALKPAARRLEIVQLGLGVAARRGASRFGQPCRRRVCPRGNSRTGALPSPSFRIPH